MKTRNDVFAGIEATEMIMLDEETERKLKPGCRHCIVPVIGDCLDSALSHTRVKNGDKLLMHQVSLKEFEASICKNDIMSFMLMNGKCYVKQFVRYDKEMGNIVVKMFNPREKELHFPVSFIKALFVVDKVLSAGYVERNRVSNIIGRGAL